MGFLAAALLFIFAAGPLVLAYLLRAELRAGPVRVGALLVASSLQILVGVWSFLTHALVYGIAPWVTRQEDPELTQAIETTAAVAGVCAILWVPAAIVLLVLSIRSVHRGEAERLQLPLVAIVFYAAALIWSAARFASP